MEKKFLDQKIRNRNSEAGNDRTATGTPAKQTGKWTKTAVNESREIATCGKRKASVPNGDACSCRHDMSTRGKGKSERETTHSPSPESQSPTRNCGKNISKGRVPRGSSPSGKKFQKSCQKYLKETCTDPFV